MTQKSYIRRSIQYLHAYVPGEQPKNEDRAVKLNTNENPYPPSPRVAEALQKMDARRLRLYPEPECDTLRKKIAALHGCALEQVFVGNGSDEVLALCARTFVERKGTIGFFNPAYSLYPILADIEEIATRPVELTSDFQWAMPKKYEASMFFLTNPNAPTSMLFPKSKIRAFCQKFKGVVVIDEAYADFAGENCMDLAIELNNVLIVRTLSKSYSLAGLRLGYAVGSKRFIDVLLKIKDSYNVDYLAQQLAIAALSDVKYMQRNVERVKKTRARITQELKKRGFTVAPSETNFLWVKPSGISALQLFEALRKKNVFVRFFSGKRTKDYLRVTLGTDQQMDRFLRAIDSI